MSKDAKEADDKNIKQIICIKWGTKYGADYANKLYGMVSLILPRRFVLYALPMTQQTYVLRLSAKNCHLWMLRCQLTP